MLFSIVNITVTILMAQERVGENDSVNTRFLRQLMAFQQEKIYLQTDKGGYLSGEHIWFRAHLTDAFSNLPIFISRYVYVEIISPVEEVVKRVKVRPDSTGAYHGHIDLPDDLPEGSYTLRAYTNYMRNMGEEAFFRKTVKVLDPFSLKIEPLITFNVEKNKIDVTLQFVNSRNNDTIVPDIVSCKLTYKTAKTLSPQKRGIYTWKTSLSDSERNRTMLVSIVYEGRKYNRYYTIPYEPNNYEVLFFSEGGYLVPGVYNKVDFKAINSGEMGENISGTLYTSNDEELLTFKTGHLGMGFFTMMPVQNETYYAVCRNEQGQTKRFNLPLPEVKANALEARIAGNRILVSLKSGSDAIKDSLFVLVHYKGQVLYYEPWSITAKINVVPVVRDFPSGIVSVLLLNARNEILSERLLFNVNKKDFSNPEADIPKASYKPRENISFKLKLPAITDNKKLPNNISISVTDMKSVVQDTTTNIVAALLLASELKGRIESPAFYFKNNNVDVLSLEALLLTQGWRRYDIPEVLAGKIKIPDAFEPEMAQKISGKADGLLGSLKEGQISLIATLDTLVSYENTRADSKGRFVFNVEYPEGTSIMVQSLSKRGGKQNLINIDKQTFPESLGGSVQERATAINQNNSNLDQYMQKADEEYMQKNGMRTVLLKEVTVKASVSGKYKESSFYSPIAATGLRTANDIKKSGINDLRSLLYTLPGIIVKNDKIITTRSELPVLFVIDNVSYEDFFDQLDGIEISSIESIFVQKDNLFLPGYYPNTNGAIVITTQAGYKGKKPQSLNISRIIPLGYQRSAEFYSPRYDTAAQKESSLPDLRTTIYWKPNVVFSKQGEAIIDFYSADLPTTYQIIGEGVGSGGEIIRFTHQISVRND